jgi:D-alanine-D-alanine ligase
VPGRQAEVKVVIQVLMGGASSEREVSLSSGSAVARGLERAGHTVATYDYNPDQGRDVNHYLASSGLREADVVFIALHGGEGEDGRIQAILELAGKPYTGSGVRASAICMDKAITKIVLEYNGVTTPAWAYLRNEEAGRRTRANAISRLGLPLVVKPVDQGSTIGLSIVEREGELEAAIGLALEYSDGIVFEKYIDGRELSVSIVGQEVFPIVEIKPREGFYDYQRKYTKGMTDYACPAPLERGLSDRIQEDALKAYRACGCGGFARVDARLDKAGVAYFLEINTIPGMTETSLVPMAAKAKGLSFEALVERIATSGLKRAKSVTPRIGG